MRLALYQPEIPQNVGTLIRLGACLNIGIDIIEPIGFVWYDKHLKRAGMDYIDLAVVQRFQNFEEFIKQKKNRIILLDTKADISFWDFKFHADDTLLLGKESSGVPEEIFKLISNSVKIPMVHGRRSLNMAIAGSIVLSEALRQVRHDHCSSLC